MNLINESKGDLNKSSNDATNDLNKGAEGVGESNSISNNESALLSQRNSINKFTSKLCDSIINIMYIAIDLLLFVILIFIMNVSNSYINDALLQLFVKIVCTIIMIFIKVKLLAKIYDNILNNDKHKLMFISLLLIVLNILCLLSVFNVIDQWIMPQDRLIICVTFPFLIIIVAIIADKDSIIPLVVIILAFIVGIVLFTLSFFVNFGDWKSSIMIAAIVYMIFGLLSIIMIVYYYFVNNNKSTKLLKYE